MKLLRYTIVVLLILLSGCEGSTDENLCYKSVKDLFPQATIYTISENKYRFVVIQDSTVYMVKTMSLSSPKVTSIEVCKKKLKY